MSHKHLKHLTRHSSLKKILLSVVPLVGALRYCIILIKTARSVNIPPTSVLCYWLEAASEL